MTEEHKVKDIIRILSTVLPFTVEIFTSLPDMEEKNQLNNYPQVNLTGKGELSCVAVSMLASLLENVAEGLSQFGYRN